MEFLKGSKAPGRRLFIHCGLHKTGTKALQIFLRNNTKRLRDAGILYPYAGCLDSVASGHHNIAWQIARDRRFDKALGDIGALAKEIGNFSGDILLSSEDFEGALGRPEAFAPLMQYCIFDPKGTGPYHLREKPDFLSRVTLLRNAGAWLW
jgi:hypothetical protein